MATYLKHYQLERSPFEGRGSEQLVLATASLRRAFAQIKAGLEEAAPRICLTGGEGIGKSSLARALPKLLANEARCVVVRDPSIEWSGVKSSIAKQLGLEDGQVSRSSLLQARADGRRIVIVVDSAEDIPAESLEHLDIILGYRDDEGLQLVQCVLLANLSGAPRGGDVPLLWWLDRLTTKQLTFAPIPEKGIRSYVDKHLAKAGWAGGALFTDDAIVAIHRYTGGVPGSVSALCEQLLSSAADSGLPEIDRSLVAKVWGDDVPEQDETRPQHEEEELPQFGSRRKLPVQASVPNTFVPREPEPKLEIQQGLLPFEESETHPDDFFGEDQRPRPTSSPRDTVTRPSHRLAHQPLPGSGRTARIVRNLTMLAVLACIAVGLHLWLTSESAPRVVKQVRAIPKAAPAPKAEPVVSVPPMVPPADRKLAARSLALEESQGREETETLDGLTSDLKLGAESSKTAAKAGDDDPKLSLRELYEIAEKADEKSEPSFEPWSQQAPEAEPPAAPAPTSR